MRLNHEERNQVLVVLVAGGLMLPMAWSLLKIADRLSVPPALVDMTGMGGSVSKSPMTPGERRCRRLEGTSYCPGLRAVMRLVFRASERRVRMPFGPTLARAAHSSEAPTLRYSALG